MATYVATLSFFRDRTVIRTGSERTTGGAQAEDTSIGETFFPKNTQKSSYSNTNTLITCPSLY